MKNVDVIAAKIAIAKEIEWLKAVNNVAKKFDAEKAAKIEAAKRTIKRKAADKKSAAASRKAAIERLAARKAT